MVGEEALCDVDCFLVYTHMIHLVNEKLVVYLIKRFAVVYQQSVNAVAVFLIYSISDKVDKRSSAAQGWQVLDKVVKTAPLGQVKTSRPKPNRYASLEQMFLAEDISQQISIELEKYLQQEQCV